MIISIMARVPKKTYNNCDFSLNAIKNNNTKNKHKKQY